MTNPTIKAAVLATLRRMLDEAPAHKERRPEIPLLAFACNCPRGLMIGCSLDRIGGTEENIREALLELHAEGLVAPFAPSDPWGRWVAV